MLVILLEKSYLCGINNNSSFPSRGSTGVVICLKNRTFVVSTTTKSPHNIAGTKLWFAWKIVPLWYQQQRTVNDSVSNRRCDLLEKLYLCGINNNLYSRRYYVIWVVICLKNCTFVVSTTTTPPTSEPEFKLWFAWKIVPLWYQQQQ